MIRPYYVRQVHCKGLGSCAPYVHEEKSMCGYVDRARLVIHSFLLTIVDPYVVLASEKLLVVVEKCRDRDSAVHDCGISPQGHLHRVTLVNLTPRVVDRSTWVEYWHQAVTCVVRVQTVS